MLCKVTSLSIHKKQFCTTFPAQGSAKKARAPGFASFVTALACHFCLILTQPWAHLFAEPCISQGILTRGNACCFRCHNTCFHTTGCSRYTSNREAYLNDVYIHNFLGFGPLPPLVCILARYIVLKSPNLPYLCMHLRYPLASPLLV